MDIRNPPHFIVAGSSRPLKNLAYAPGFSLININIILQDFQETFVKNTSITFVEAC